MKIVRRGALPVGGESGLFDVRDRAAAGFGASARRGDVSELDVWPGFVEKVISFVDPGSIAPLRVVVDAANGMAGTMLPPVLERLPHRRRALLLRARRVVPEPRAEPAPAREPRVHRRGARARGRRPRRRLRRRRRPLLLRRRHRRVRARRLRHRAARALDARARARRQGDLRRARELGRAAHDRGGGGIPLVNRVGHAFIKHRMREGGRGLRRRGVGALLLPRLHPGGQRHRARSCSCSS